MTDDRRAERPPRRQFAQETRGVSNVIGSVLLFGILIAMLVAFQVTAVPVFNQEVEYEHNQRVQSQFDLLRTNLVLTTTIGDDTSTHVELGTDYPSRPPLFNPPPAAGAIRTGQTGTVAVDNAIATGEVGDYWNGASQTFTTRPIVYRPDYNEYGNAPTTRIENGVLYNQFDSGQLALSDENLVDGRRISLLLVEGDLDRTGINSHNVDVEPTSAPARTVTVTDGAAPITLTIPTQVTESKWQELLADEFVAQGGHVTTMSYLSGDPYNQLVLELEPDVTYELTLAKAGIGTGIAEPSAHYITTVESEERRLPLGRSTKLTVEVRDKYDNPVSGVTVDAGVTAGDGTVTAIDATTGSDGRATFRYSSPGTPTTATIETRIADTPTPRERATFTMEVFDLGQTTDFLDMGQSTNVEFVAVTSPTGNNNNKAEIDFLNSGTSAKEIVAARFVSYYDSAPSSPPPTSVVVDASGTVIEEGGSMTPLGSAITIPAGSTERITFDFRDAAGDPSGAISKADFIFVSFRFSDGSESMYLIQLTTK